MNNEVDERAAFKRRVIKVLLTGDIRNIRVRDFAISEEERDAILRKLFAKEITNENGEKISGAVLRPSDIHGDEVIFERMTPEGRNMLAFVGGLGADGNEANIETFRNVLQLYPSAKDFGKSLGALRQKAHKELGGEKYKELFDGMDSFEKSLYGRQYDYWMAFVDLKAEAREKFGKKTADEAAADDAVAEEPIEAVEPKKKEIAPLPKVAESDDLRIKANPNEALLTNGYGDIFELNPDNSMTVLRASQIEVNDLAAQYMREHSNGLLGGKVVESGDELYTGICSGLYATSDGEQKLTIEMLEMADLSPSWMCACDGRNIALSKMMSVDGENVIIGYVNAGTFWRVVSFFKGVARENWRLLPDYVLARDGKMLRFGAGVAQLVEQFVLPFSLQIALARVEASGVLAQTGELDKRLLTLGTAQRIPSAQTYLRSPRRSAVFQETDRGATMELSHTGGVGGDNMRERPEKMVIDEGILPDYLNVVASWQEKNETSGIITQRALRSLDGQLIYTFSEDDKGRAWLSHAEMAVSPVNSFGVRASFVKCGDVATPLYELPVRAGVAADHDVKDKVKVSTGAEYISMWPYVRRIELVRNYIKSRR